MTVENGGNPAGSPGAGGAGDGKGAGEGEPKTVPHEKYLELLAEKKAAKAKADAAEAKLAAIEEEKLKASGDLQKIIDAEKAKNAELSTKLTNFDSTLKDAKKLSAFRRALGPNVDEKWFAMIDPSSIQFKPDTDEIDPASLSANVEAFKKTWPEALKAPGNMPPANMPGASGKITESEWKKLGAKDMKKHKPSDIEWGK